MITFRQKGDFSKTFDFFERAKEIVNIGVFDKYGKMGVDALASNTPKDTGLAASSWHYKIERNQNGARLVWYNDDIEGGYNVAILIQYGHATRNGGYVAGRDFINPAIAPIFDQMADELWKEVEKN